MVITTCTVPKLSTNICFYFKLLHFSDARNFSAHFADEKCACLTANLKVILCERIGLNGVLKFRSVGCAVRLVCLASMAH